MPDYIIFNKLNGKPRQSVSCDSGQISSQLLEDKDSFIEVEAFYDITKIWIAGEVIEFIPPKPNDYSEFNWQTKQWDIIADWLDKARKDNIIVVNKSASQKILPKYPIYLQLNLPYDFGQDSVEVQTMRTWIDSVRTLANTAKAEIALATTLEEITTIVDNFKQELAEIS